MFKYLIILLTSAVIAQPILPIQEWQTANNTPVWLLTRHDLPIIDISLVYNAGARKDGNLPGLAAITNAMIDQGTDELSFIQIKNKIDQSGAQITHNITKDYATLHLRSLSAPNNYNAAIDIFTKIIKQPKFKLNRLTTIKTRHTITLQNQEKSPNDIAINTFFNQLYRKHPYGHNTIGTIPSINKITANNLRNFFKKHYNQKQVKIIIVGDINKAQAQQLALKIENNLPKAQSYTSQPKAIRPIIKKVIQIPFNSKQTTVVLGSTAIDVKSNDLVALTVGNHIMGSGMNSYLFDNIREKNGWAYMIYSQIIPLKDPGPFFVIMQTQQKELKKIIKKIKSTISNFSKNGPSKEQLFMAKSQILGRLYETIGTNSGAINLLTRLAAYNQPITYMDDFINKVNNLSIQNIQTAFAKIISKPDKLLILVGPPSKEL